MTREEKTMQTTNKDLAGEARERTAAWAERLVQRRRHVQEAVPAREVRAEEWIPGAITVLWALLDEAIEQANAALEDAGLAERIGTRRTSREYWLSMAGPGGEPREMALFVSLQAVQGRASGGAQITTSQTRATIYLVPSVHGGRPRWIVARTGRDFTPHVVDDVLLSVFGDDPAATVRLSPYFSLGEDEGV
jgi:hypothetical protein